MTDQTVLAPPNLSLSNHKYHTNYDCHNASDRAREVTIEQAEQMGLTECSVCSGEKEYKVGGSGHYRALVEAAEANDD